MTPAGADIVSATDGSGVSLAVSNGGVTIVKDTTMTFNLTKLHTGGVVTVSVEGKRGGSSAGKKALQFTVVGGS